MTSTFRPYGAGWVSARGCARTRATRFSDSVPTPIIHATCYAFRPEVSGHGRDPDAEGLSRAERANADGLYPPLFYAAMSTLATTDVPSSVLAMRIMNSAFAVGLLTGVFFALPRRLRPALLVSILATAVPLGMFLLASTNPSSWAILSAATVWICLYGAMLDRARKTRLTALAVFGGVIGAGARADSAAFAVFGGDHRRDPRGSDQCAITSYRPSERA